MQDSTSATLLTHTCHNKSKDKEIGRERENTCKLRGLQRIANDQRIHASARHDKIHTTALLYQKLVSIYSVFLDRMVTNVSVRVQRRLECIRYSRRRGTYRFVFEFIYQLRHGKLSHTTKQTTDLIITFMREEEIRRGCGGIIWRGIKWRESEKTIFQKGDENNQQYQTLKDTIQNNIQEICLKANAHMFLIISFTQTYYNLWKVEREREGHM